MSTAQEHRADPVDTQPRRSAASGAGPIRWDGPADTFDATLTQTLTGLCARRGDVLAHAVRAPDSRWPFRPLGVLYGAAALEYADLGSALFRLQPAGTGLTRAAVRERGPVWMPSIAQEPVFARGSLLARYGICSGAAFPVSIGSKLAAVIEVLSFVRLEHDPDLADTVADLLATPPRTPPTSVRPIRPADVADGLDEAARHGRRDPSGFAERAR